MSLQTNRKAELREISEFETKWLVFSLVLLSYRKFNYCKKAIRFGPFALIKFSTFKFVKCSSFGSKNLLNC